MPHIRRTLSCQALLALTSCYLLALAGCQFGSNGQVTSLTTENKILVEQNRIQEEELANSRTQLLSLNERLRSAEIQLAEQQEKNITRR